MSRPRINKKLLRAYFGPNADITPRVFGSGYTVKMPNGASVIVTDKGLKNFRGGPEIYGPAYRLALAVWGEVVIDGTPQHIIQSLIHAQEIGLPTTVRQKRSWFASKPPVQVPRVSGAHGSAGIATDAMLRACGLTGGTAGRGYRLGEDNSGSIIRYAGRQSGISIIGPPRSGKQVTLATAMLIENQDAAWLLVDPKLELLAITLRRRAALGPFKKIIPFKEGLPAALAHHADESDSFNPLLGMDPRSESYVIGCDLLAETIIVPDAEAGRSGGGFFTENAQSTVSAVTMHLLEKFPNKATLPKVASIICGPDLFAFAADAMINGSPYVRDRLGVFGNPAASKMQGGINDILRTLLKGLKWLSDPAIQRVLQTPASPWRFDDLKRGSRPMTIYLGVPSKFAQAARGLTRLLFGCAASDLLSTPPGKRQVCLLADEFHAMGRVSIFETCFSEGGGHGLVMMPICQTSGQLIDAYGEQGYRNVQSGTEIHIFLPPRDLAQAEEISALAGRRTILTAGLSASASKDEWGGMNVGETGQDVLDPHSVMALSPDRMIIHAPGLVRDIIVARRRPYWQYADIARFCDPNPYAPGAESPNAGAQAPPPGSDFLRWFFG